MNYLLNIAIDNYNGIRFSPLNNAVKDAERFEKNLTERYGFETIEESLFNENAGREQILEALNRLTTHITKDDNLIIYFAGHGEIHPKTELGYLIPQDGEDKISGYIPNSTIVDTISGIDAHHIFLILDSCFSGSFLANNRSGLNFPYSKLIENKSRFVLSSGRVEKVDDGAPGVGSPFSLILNEFLEKNKSRSLSIQELASAVITGTGKHTKQQPIFAHIEGVGHEDGQMVLSITDSQNEKPKKEEVEVLSKIVIPIELAMKIRDVGFTQNSIFAYYKNGDSFLVKQFDTSNNFISSAFTYEEIAKFIPEMIEVDENTFIAKSKGYEKLGPTEEGYHDYAEVTYQLTEVQDTPYMAICRCRGAMVAFSKNDKGQYNNLISWGKNQAETAALMILDLVEEKKIKVK